MNTESSSMQEFLEQIRRDAPDNLVIHNPDSNILQLYELNTPFMILLETCHEKDNFFSIYQITPGNTYSSQSTYSQYKALSKRPLHQHSCYEIMFVLSGSITNHVENQTFTYGPGQCCVMNKNIKHCEIVAGDFQVVFFMIQDVFLEQLLEEYEEVSEHKTEAPGMNPIFQLYLDSLHKTSRFHKVYLDYLPVIPADSILEQLNPLFNFMLEEIRKTAPDDIRGQLDDNIHWIREAGRNKLVVGSQARILYADCEGRTKIAEAFNRAIADGRITAPVVLGRDHHDVSGTDSPYRETSNIYDGSCLTADMAVQNVIGDSFRGATWVSIHNGGGVGWGEVVNGGFGMVIDGSEESDRHIREMLLWDVNNGIARRSWARNEGAVEAIRREMDRTPGLRVTLPSFADEDVVRNALNDQAASKVLRDDERYK